jgi:hypothetical protein
MSFDLEITISGICAFVENSNGQGPVCVVMPSVDTDRNAVDDEPLCPHVSYIEQGFGFSTTKTYLKRQRVSFKLEEDGSYTNADITSIRVATQDIVGLLDIVNTRVNNKTNKDVVALSVAPPAPVMNQVVLTKGSVSFTYDGSRWDFNPQGPGVLAAHEVVILVSRLKSAHAILEPFDGGSSTVVSLSPPTGTETVALKIVNTCARSVYPLGEARRDRDYKWYYELLEDYQSISLGNEDLAIPRLVSFPLIGGNNCFPSHLSPAPIL